MSIRNLKLFLGILLLLPACVQIANAQELISTAGHTIKNSNGSVSWSVGELVTETVTGPMIITQGFHQTDVIITALEETENFNICVFPNPATREILIQTMSGETGTTYRLIDLQNREIKNGTITNGVALLNIGEIANGAYILWIVNSQNRILKSFKLIKQTTD